MNKRSRDYLVLMIISLFISGLAFVTRSFTEILAVTVALFFLLKFPYDLGSSLSVKNIMAMIATFQWLLGPVLGYIYNDSIYPGYQMAISSNQYFAFVLPATLAYLAGMYITVGKSKKMMDFRNYPIDYYAKGMALIIIGFIGGFLPLGFLSYILGGLKYVGLFYMFASKNPKKYYWIIPVFGFLVYSSLQNAMFHDLILWGSFFSMLYFIFKKVNLTKRLLYIGIGVVLVVMIQLVKGDYRGALLTETAQNTNSFGLYWQVIRNKFSDDNPVLNEQAIANNVVRLNQGWIIARVMLNVPTNTPYAEGQTIKNAIVASIIPRIIDPDKAIAGGHNNMETYAGITLNEYTSMDISQMGEAYANFGPIGGVFFMFILGLFFNWIIFFIEKKTRKHPDLVFWIPLIFLQAIKAETSLLTILNHVAKTALVTWAFFSPWGNFFINRFFVRKKRALITNTVN